MQTIKKAINILEIFLKHEGEIGLSELAKLSGLNISAVHRITSAFVSSGYLNQRQKGGKYSLGLKFLEFSNIVKKRLKIRDVAIPLLEKLHNECNETINLAILDANAVVIIEMFESGHALRMSSEGGGWRIPLHCTALGKVLLAHMAEEEVKWFLRSKGLSYSTEKTIRDPSKLREELLVIRKEGIAIDDEEFETGARCVGVPVKDCDGNIVVAISASGPTARLTDETVEELKPMVKSCGLAISRALGYRGE